MWRYIILVNLFFCFFGSTSTFAQKVDDDIIKIKNGPTIYGGLDSIRRDTVFFRINGKIPVTYAVSEIEEFRKTSDQSNPKKEKLRSPAKELLARPDSANIYIAFSTGISFFRAISPKISAGYRLHRAFTPIISVDYSSYINASGTYLGFSGGITGSAVMRKSRPYYNLQWGYGLNQTAQNTWTDGEIISKTGGTKMDIGVGIIQPIIDANNLVTIGLNYGTQNASFKYNTEMWNWRISNMEKVVVDEKIRYNRLYLTLGIIF